MKTIPSLSNLQQQLSHVASRDYYRLNLQLKKLMRYEEKECADENSRAIAKLKAEIDRSVTFVSQKQARIKPINFTDELPISEKRDMIAKAINEHQVVVVAGETGSGKTTQLPKICLELGRGLRGMVGHTQPRRLAARSVASRIAEELESPLGELVGYQVRFTDQVSDLTAIKLMTDGILLAEIQKDRFLNRYDTIIIDEAHERSLNIDFLLGFLKQLLPKRPDLKLIITSATIDLERFSNHFNQAPIIEVSGRTYPVEVRYRPLLETESDTLNDAVVTCVREITDQDRQGDILVFLSGEREIRELSLRLRREAIPHLSILPLYARLSISEQNKIFHTQKGQRVVLATNVAETSLTVPGIRYVIDPGYARISRYSFRTKMQRLPVEAISQASANQRMGRCGRVAEGICYRLFDEQDFLSRPEFTDPEILRTNLAAVILQMEQLRLGDVRDFPFVDPPDHRLINDGYKVLQKIQAIDQRNRLTPLGKKMVRLPVDPRFARMLLAAEQGGCLSEMVTLVSGLSIQDPRERPVDKQQAADQAHRQYWHEHSDFMGYLNLWQCVEEQRQLLTQNQLQKWCRRQFLAYNRIREWRDIHGQISIALKQLKVKWNSDMADYSAIHTALLTGMLDNIGRLDSEKKFEYIGARNHRFTLFPASSQFKKRPKWVIAAELIETSKVFAHTVASIQTDWVLQVAQHQIKRSHSEPHYHASSGQVMAFEKISLYGLVLVEKRRVGYGRINPVESRDLFIRGALVEGQYANHKKIQYNLKHSSPENHFFAWQQKLLTEIYDLEAKSRCHNILVDDQVLFDFYNARVPNNIVNIDGFEYWRKQVEKEQPRLLFIEREQLMQRGATDVSAEQFPDHLVLNGLTFELTYHFDPAHRDDGVTIKVPVKALHAISKNTLGWLVPGLLAEKITAMIKALPKRWRKQFAPVPTTVQTILPYLSASNTSLEENLSKQLLRLTGVQLPENCWHDIQIDPYYLMNIHVLDEKGKVINSGRNLEKLRECYRDQVNSHLRQDGKSFEQHHLTRWDFGELSKTHSLQQGGLEIPVFPQLVDCGDNVSITLADDLEQAAGNSLRAMVRLALLHFPDSAKYMRKQLSKQLGLELTIINLGSSVEVVDDILCATVRQCCFSQVKSANTLIRQEEKFLALVDAGRAQWIERAQSIADILMKALQRAMNIKKQLKQSKNPLALVHVVSDIQQQLDGLFYPGCLYDTPFPWLQCYDRYLQGIEARLEKVPRQVNQDRAMTEELQVMWQRYQERRKTLSRYAIVAEELEYFRWMLEELRVSLFAQTLGTSVPVSIKRLNRQWQLC